MGMINKTIMAIALFALAFGFVSLVQAGGGVTSQIVITALKVDEYKNGIGYVDFKNEVEDIFLEEHEDYNISGVLRVYCDDTLVISELITLEVISFHGFAVNRPDTREFEIDVTEGTHKLWAVFESTDTSEAVYMYEVVVEEEAEEEVEEEEDWLLCP